MCVTGLCVIYSRFTDGDITECYIYKSGTDSLDSIHPLRLFFFPPAVSQISAEGKNSKQCDEQRQIWEQSVCFSIR